MTFEVRIRAGEAETTKREFRSQQEVLEAWRADAHEKLRPATLKAYGFGIGQYMKAWPDLEFLEATPKDIVLFMERYARACRHYHRAITTEGQRPSCNKKHPLSGCGFTCPAYKPRPYTTCMALFTNIIHLYKFLIKAGCIESNPAIAAKDEWSFENKHLDENQAKRCPTKEDVRAFLTYFRPIYLKFPLFALAKWGLRESEAVALTVSKTHVQRGYMEIPFFKGKRKGNRVLVIDEEAKLILVDYLRWRGDSDSDQLLLNRYRRPLSVDQLASRIASASLSIGLEQPGDEPHDRIRPHSFRHFFSTELKSGRRGEPIDEYWWHVLRGDSAGANQRTYIHPSLENIRAQFLRHGPLLYS